jgi:hypothetical protein
LRLPAGPAYVIHWSAPANKSTPAEHYIDTRLYESGRQYLLSFVVRESEFERRRAAIGFMLANFWMTSTPRPCCADPVAVP